MALTTLGCMVLWRVYSSIKVMGRLSYVIDGLITWIRRVKLRDGFNNSCESNY